ncbi:hypothetical protein R6242_03615 [Iodobacter sp. CM08]|uniref:hypothetical protein n=1 Tax=Iodobacter sp. CM08 TaxID=3085902 RepID=UPI002981ED8F|nr:hypothetical protein [Iodobacter sp. CM08]MDW5415657.1 hypothetical protein [Iodobacter sp. CM08]
MKIKRLVLIAASICIGLSAHAKDAKLAATATIEKALSCELPKGKYKTVQKALSTLGAKASKDGEYTLSTPVNVFGLQVTQLSISNDDVEIYIATLPGAKLDEVGKTAKLKPLAGDYSSNVAHGTLSAAIRNRTEVALSCVVSK